LVCSLSMSARTLGTVALLLTVATAGEAKAAGEDRIALGEVSVSASSQGVDRAALKSAAEGEIRTIDPSRVTRSVVVSVAVIGTSDGPVAVSVNAMLRDGKTGNMIAILEGRARAEGTGGADLRRAVLRAAVRSAVRQIPAALSAK
jgi:hypothetical protein